MLVLVSKDEHFFYREAQPGAAVQLVWIRLGNCRTAGLLATIERAVESRRTTVGTLPNRR